MEKKNIESPGKKEDYISYEDFLALCDEDTLAEWVNGKIEWYSPASNVHQDMVRWLTAVLSVYVEAKKLRSNGCGICLRYWMC